jgi:hypothetical protein
MEGNDLQEEIGRVLESGALGSAQLRRILEYLGKAAADGRENLKEYTIAVEALAKHHSYDPQMDSTVRVQVGNSARSLIRIIGRKGLTTLSACRSRRAHFDCDW